MLFNSYEFIFGFLPVVLIGFFWLGRKGRTRWALIWLTLASLFFYGWWSPGYLVLLVMSITVNFVCGSALAALPRSRRDGRGRAMLAAGIVCNLGLIGYYKYANFFIDTANEIAGTTWFVGTILLPIGISFYTFQQIAYLVDAWRGECERHDVLQYSLFVTFFPQLIAGPIVHHKEILPQLNDRRIFRPRLDNLAIGGTIFAIGLFKKVVIADTLALGASPVFDAAESGATLHFFQAWQGAVSYTLQLYFDFSGYSDMAIGLARLFGIRLPVNFASPYQATSIIDFWRRWHITLSRFLRDYLYIPLGGNRKGRARRHLNLLITMALGGLWHGAGWTFVLWGTLHGLYLIVNHVWQRVRPPVIGAWWSRAAARLVTLFFVIIAWVLFRAETIDGALAVFGGMTNLPHTLARRIGPVEDLLLFLGFRFEGPGIARDDLRLLLWAAFWIAFLWCMPNTQQWMAKVRPAYGPPSDWPWPGGRRVPDALRQRLMWQPTRAWAAFTGVVLAVSVLGLTRVTEFLYFQF